MGDSGFHSYSGIQSDSVQNCWELGFKVQGSGFKVCLTELHTAIKRDLRQGFELIRDTQQGFAGMLLYQFCKLELHILELG